MSESIMFSGARIQRRFVPKFTRDTRPSRNELETDCKLKCDPSWNWFYDLLGWSYSSKGHLCFFLKSNLATEKHPFVYKWLSDFEQSIIEGKLKRISESNGGTQREIIVFSGPDENYPCQGIWLSAPFSLMEAFGEEAL